MDYFRNLSSGRLLPFVFFLFTFSLPASAATFSFVEFNIAFVLGLSLPVLIISSLMKPLIGLKLRYPALLTLFLLANLYAFAHLHQNAMLALLSLSSCFLLTVFLWPLNSPVNQMSTRSLFTTRAAFVSTAVFLAIVWFLPDLDAYQTWLIYGVAILLLSGLRMANLLHGVTDITVRVIVRWLVILSYIVATYLWLNARISLNTLLIVSVLGYVITLLSGSWIIVQSVLEKLSAKYQTNTATADDIYSYTHDYATNLPSHQYALAKFDNQMKQSNDSRYAAIVFSPVNFQQVNTILGHHNSDILLLQFAFTLSSHLTDNKNLMSFESNERPVRIARLQSLHFLLVLDLTDNKHPDKDVVAALCKDVSAAVPKAMSFKSFSLNFELAFGVAITSETGTNAAETIACAEDALIESVRNESLVSFYDQQSAFYTERHLRQMELLKNDIVEEKILWQVEPQISLQDKKIRGFDLGASWNNADVKPLALSELIHLAEHGGEIYILTKQMIKQAFKLLFSIQKLGIYSPVTVNLSSKDLLEPDLVDYIEAQSSRYNIPTKYLTIALKEKVILSAGQRAKYMIDQLKAINVEIAIDDFSGSYESLRYMRKMAVNQVKINCNRLLNEEDIEADKAIINALVSLAKTMELPLIGTEVSNNDVSHAYQKMGGDVGQGKLIKQGLAVEDVEAWISFWQKQHPQLS